MKYDFTAIEKKWQTRWAEEKTFACQNGDTTKPKFYGLVEFWLVGVAFLEAGKEGFDGFDHEKSRQIDCF